MRQKSGTVCVTCASLGLPVRKTPGSLGLEIALWLLGIVTLPILIGGLILLGALAYSIWRLAGRYDACPRCGGRQMVPRDSPVGTEIVLKHYAPKE